MEAFQTTGVYPLNRDAVKTPIKSSVVNEFADKSGLYIPLYSPAVSQKSQQKHPVLLPSPSLAPSPDSQLHLATASPIHLPLMFLLKMKMTS